MSTKNKKSKAKSGTWVPREMIYSEAFWALNGTAKGMILILLLKRDMNSNHECTNCRSLIMTYKELEALHKKSPDGSPRGIARTSITRAVVDLMEKGFIDIVDEGGCYQKHKAVYALVDDWKWWAPGIVVRKKKKGKTGWIFCPQKKLNHRIATHRHHHIATLKMGFRVASRYP